MTALEVFDYSGAQVRTVLVDGEPWFVAADVAAILSYRKASDMLRVIPDEDKGAQIVRTLGGDQTAAVISEPGLYGVIMQRQAGYLDDDGLRAQVRAFQRWVTHEVLPTIRRTGQFGSQVPATFAQALELAAIQAKAIEAQEAALAAAAPKVEAFDRFMDADGLYSMEAVAKIIGGIGRNTLFARLREAGVIEHGSTLPYQRHMHHFEVVASTWVDPNTGKSRVSRTTKVRPSGLPFIMRKLNIEEKVS